MEERQKNDIYREIGERVINSRLELVDVKQSTARIGYLESNKAKKKNGRQIFGECRRVKDSEKWCNPYDYEIIIYQPNVQELSEKQLEILIFHELLHIDISENKKGEEVFHVKSHDVAEFMCIINEFGLDWDNPQKTFDFDEKGEKE